MAFLIEKPLRAAALVAACALVSAASFEAQTGGAAPARGAAQSAGLDVLELEPNLHMIAGAGGNIAVQTGPDGVVVVDSGSGAMSDEVIAAIRRLSDQPIRYIINTSANAEHVGGNQAIAAAGRSLALAGGNVAAGGTAGANTPGAVIVAAEPVLLRMSAPTGETSPFPVAAWPAETFPRRKTLYLNHEGIEIVHQPAAHSDGDSIVFFRRSDVVATGDLVDTTRFPVIDVERGGSIDGEIAALNRLVDLVIAPTPLVWKDDGTRVIPGHGRIADQADLVEYRDMVTIVRDVVKSLVDKGMSLEQVIAAAPAKGYVLRYGRTPGPGSTDAFVESIYRSLTRRPK